MLMQFSPYKYHEISAHYFATVPMRRPMKLTGKELIKCIILTDFTLSI